MRVLADEAATLAAGAGLARALGARFEPRGQGLHLHLRGALGAGKTTLVRGMLRALGVAGTVRSPTYTLVEPYRTAAGEVFHFDLYRLGDAQELELLGARDYFRPGVVCVFEWPERGGDWLPDPDLVLELGHQPAGRSLRIQGHGPAGEALAARLESHPGS